MATGRNYERRGDPFTQKVRRGEGPPSVRGWFKQGTGREYYTRVLVSDCHRLDVAELAQVVRDHAQHLTQFDEPGPVDLPKLARLLAFDWETSEHRVSARLADQAAPAGAVRVTMTTSNSGPKGQGVRFWAVCPRCSRRCGVLYASRWGARGQRLPQHIAGCRECLGLTDESRQRHKCLDWASAVLEQRPYTASRRGRYQARQWSAAGERALYVFQAGAARSLPGYMPKPSRPERWGLGPCPWGKAAGDQGQR